ncbi:DUF397 domain-containing protein [Streptomyces sp. SAT1]|uniref:DUF397 domain-containing protein n=1 Tax=Streptomyces sp. SAT1 TaxID=1849967 RepID=UPI0007DDBC14|nr:DUF397 domain-containing protein [Streptomyces sp. SAT1]ANH93039.1 DUF397 domain-containing protein [Streptomyces sp. SAT1]
MKQSKAIDLSRTTWRKSSYSSEDGADCVEVAGTFPALVPVRDSKNPAGPVLLFQRSAWAPFLSALKD